MCSCFSFSTVRTRVGLPSEPPPPPETPEPPTPPTPRSPLLPLLPAPRDLSPLSFRVDVVMQVSELSVESNQSKTDRSYQMRPRFVSIQSIFCLFSSFFLIFNNKNIKQIKEENNRFRQKGQNEIRKKKICSTDMSIDK